MSDRWLMVAVEPEPERPARHLEIVREPVRRPPLRRTWTRMLRLVVAGILVMGGIATAMVGAWWMTESADRWDAIAQDAAEAGLELGDHALAAAASLAEELGDLESNASTLDEVSEALEAAARIASELEAMVGRGLPAGPDGVESLVREMSRLAGAIDAAYPGLADLGVAGPEGPGDALRAAGAVMVAAAEALGAAPPTGFGPFVLRYPLPGYPVTNPFGTASNGGFHGGVDMAAPTGTAILAADDGTVQRAGFLDEAAGNGVIVRHEQGWETRYFHMASSDLPVAVGDEVAAGQVIGYVGSTGQSTGPHLHFEIVIGPIRMDPESGFSFVGRDGAGAVSASPDRVRPLGGTAEEPLQATAAQQPQAAIADVPAGVAEVQQDLVDIGTDADRWAAEFDRRRIDERERGRTTRLVLFGGLATVLMGMLLWIGRPWRSVGARG